MDMSWAITEYLDGVPEPSTLTVFGILGFGFLVARRKQRS
ncbi:MAG TPA: PEP-CTERM sorting domain-containing protein [Fimbriimonadales bacterium]|nr:PEP-CTERM sorting domain-containing protein [Fimbriimonadales bacterium]